MTNSFAALDVKEDITRISPTKPVEEEEKTLVNTSLPAKQAPVLPPATLASLTSNGATPRPFIVSGLKPEFKELKPEPLRPKQKPLEATDFPALSSKKPASIALVQKTSFSELSKEWAKKQKEEEQKMKEEKEKEAIEQQTLNKKKMEEENARRMGVIPMPVLLSKKLDPEEEAIRKREMAEKELSDEDSSFEAVSAAYDEEESEEEYDCDWNQRKHRDELY